MRVRARDLTDVANEAAASAWREEGVAPRRAHVALFKHPWLDLATRVPPWMPYAIAMPVVAFSLQRAARDGLSIPGAVITVTLGVLLWSLVEYAMHRFAFHAHADGETARIALLLAHGHHHVWPDDKRRIAATPVQLGSLLLLFFGLLVLPLGTRAGLGIYAGFVIGYAAYEWLHYLAHHGRSTIGWLAWLRAHHMHHHHRDPGMRWGISTPLWDYVFRTI